MLAGLFLVKENMMDEKSQLEALKKALTPSAETKFVYSSEIFYTTEDSEGEVQKHYVPWTAIKDIMKLIRKYAGQE